MNTVVPAGAPWSGIVRRGQVLRITDLEGQQAVDFLCYNAADLQERYHAPNTMKAAGTIFQCRPLCSSKYRKALENATAPYEKLKMPVALYDSVMPAAMSE